MEVVIMVECEYGLMKDKRKEKRKEDKKKAKRVFKKSEFDIKFH
jgi:hypothetical protein